MDDKMEQLKQAVGKADVCELMGRAFSFPERDLAVALSNGSFRSDALSCLDDAGADSDTICLADAFGLFFGSDPDELLGRMRRSYSLLFLQPGDQVPVWPYESAFLYVRAGRKGAPSLISSPTSLAVQELMRGVGVVPDRHLAEPCDSIWSELRFLSYLYGLLAEGFAEQMGFGAETGSGSADVRSTSSDQPSCPDALESLAVFERDHAAQWIPVFMRQVSIVASSDDRHSCYVPLARVGMAACRALGLDRGGS